MLTRAIARNHAEPGSSCAPAASHALFPAKAAAQKNPALGDAPGFSSIGQFHLTDGVE
jgi:hypothetical protein